MEVVERKDRKTFFFNDRLVMKRLRMVIVTLCCPIRRIFLFEFLIVSHCKQFQSSRILCPQESAESFVDVRVYLATCCAFCTRIINLPIWFGRNVITINAEPLLVGVLYT